MFVRTFPISSCSKSLLRRSVCFLVAVGSQALITWTFSLPMSSVILIILSFVQLISSILFLYLFLISQSHSCCYLSVFFGLAVFKDIPGYFLFPFPLCLVFDKEHMFILCSSIFSSTSCSLPFQLMMFQFSHLSMFLLHSCFFFSFLFRFVYIFLFQPVSSSLHPF